MTKVGTENSYKDSLKATSLFGGVQVYNILIQIIRSKLVAVLLGPSGMGIMGLLNSTTGLISAFTNCGLGTSAVRNIAEADTTNDIKKVTLVITVFRKLVWITGLLGTLVCLVFAPYWSKLTFGNTDYTFAFIILSVNILLMQLTSGQNALLQGLRKYKYLAKANVLGNTIGLFITIPLYYYWGIKAIVPVLLLANMSSFSIAYYFASKVKVENIAITVADLKREGKDMVKMGLLIGLQGMLSVLVSYLIRIFITQIGSLDDVGLYTAGFTIVNTYVGLVFTAMGTDYYPRLSGFSHDNEKFKQTINQQAEISLLLLTPLIITFIVYIKWIVLLLYSTKFLPTQGMIYWAIAAIPFKAMSWSLSYSLLAKGDSKAFFWNETITIFYGFGLNAAGYYFYGLTGLGISFFITYFLYFFQLWVITGKRYQFSFEPNILKMFLLMLAVSLLCLVLRVFAGNAVSYSVGTLLVILTTLYSFKGLDKRIALKEMITNRFNRWHKN
jgi:O-antigen/teichoic acid export membrane protein